MATLNSTGQAIATPTINHVLVLDQAVRKKQAELLNEGHDWKAALDKAKESDRLFQVSFLNCVAIDINTPACRSVTAPGVAQAQQGQKRNAAAALEDGPPAPHPGNTLRNAQKRANKKANARAKNAAATTQAPAPNGNPYPKGKDGKGKGKDGKNGRTARASRTFPTGLSITPIPGRQFAGVSTRAAAALLPAPVPTFAGGARRSMQEAMFVAPNASETCRLQSPLAAGARPFRQFHKVRRLAEPPPDWGPQRPHPLRSARRSFPTTLSSPHTVCGPSRQILPEIHLFHLRTPRQRRRHFARVRHRRRSRVQRRWPPLGPPLDPPPHRLRVHGPRPGFLGAVLLGAVPRFFRQFSLAC